MSEKNGPSPDSNEPSSTPPPSTLPPSAPPLAQGLLYGVGSFLARLIYHVRVIRPPEFPEGGVLLLPNHISWVDAIILQLACPRRVRYLIFEGIYNIPWLNPIFRTVGAIPISGKHPKSGLTAAVDGIKRGEVVCVFPEGELSRTGNLLRLKRGFELIARGANAPVVPVWLDELWGSIFSFERQKYFFKIPKRIPYRVTVAFGKPIHAEEATGARVREELLELGELCYQHRPLLQGHLAEACLRGLKRGPGKTAFTDGMDGSTLSRGKLLGASIALALHLRKNHPGDRIGIVLPPGKAAVIANLAALFSGKTPVNLNFTSGRSSIESALSRAEISCVLSAGPMKKRLEDFPWPEDSVMLEKLLPSIKSTIVRWVIFSRLLPWRILKAILKIPSRGDREEAVLLFTSGSSGEPKGVVLSHRNVLGNVSQFGQMLSLADDDSMLACLPFFHSFGCTVTLWYPIIEGVHAVTYTSPLEVQKNAELIEQHKISILLSTASFLRGYLRRAKPEQLSSLRLVIAGAEKLPRELADAWQERFGQEVLEGYGLTETAPVASVNLPDPPLSRGADSFQPANRPGSVGKLAPGMAAQIRDPDTNKKLSLFDTGMLWLRGPNIFEGYLHDPERTAEVIQDGWFKTGDLARMDEDGFLFIEGRLSRFSKLGGEMVPHETVETALLNALDRATEDERCLAVVGIPDPAKGEALVLLTTLDMSAEEVREKISAAGLPNLWAPRQIKKVESIPILASGKLDLGALKQAALED
ncbi:MAG: AMP-binding protein [Verrucomicrobiales bacterium]